MSAYAFMSAVVVYVCECVRAYCRACVRDHLTSIAAHPTFRKTKCFV